MKTADVVIGAHYGDEGKGLITDYLASKHSVALVVRFNGGAQAGHTVVTPNGQRHVFGHFGSGTLLNHPTYLSKYFIVNPALFVKELDTLDNKNPVVFISPDAFVTTPFEMLINQALEASRTVRHGSCGVGINETIERHKYLKIQVKDLQHTALLRIALEAIREEYVPQRLSELNIKMTEKISEILNNKQIMTKFISDCQILLSRCYIADEQRALNLFDHVIFEGAQGLLLDQNNTEHFPHVTRSNTGLVNVMDLIQSFDIPKINAYFVTRWYVTRHGAGALPHEPPIKALISSQIEDKTNVPNEYQGYLRFGFLNINTLRKNIHSELISSFTSKTRINTHVALTCVDQAGGNRFPVMLDDEPQTLTFTNLMRQINPTLVSFGETRDDIVNNR